MQVIAQLEDPTADLTPMYMYNKFIERVRRNLHLVLAFSPIGYLHHFKEYTCM